MAKLSFPPIPTTLNLPTIPYAFNNNYKGKVIPAGRTFTRSGAIATHIDGALGLRVDDAADVPRFTKDGLLIEPSAINRIFYSNDLSQANWTKTGVTTTANSGYDSYGLNNLWLCSAANDVGCTQGRSVTAGVITLSCEIRQGTATKLLLRDYTNSVDISFVFATKAMVSSGASYIASGYEDLGEGLYKLWLTLTSGTTAGFTIRPSTQAGTTTHYQGHMEIKEGYYTSYVPTVVASAVTRASDVLTVSAANFTQYRQDVFTEVVNFIGKAYGTQTYFDYHDGTANNRIYLESINSALTFNIITGGVAQCALSLGSVTNGTEYTAAMAWKLNDVAACLNGGAVVTDASVTLPTVTQKAEGMNYAGANQCGVLGFLRGYAARLPNEQLQGLTA